MSRRIVCRYSSDNCAVVFPDPNNPPKDPLEMFPGYLSHKSGINIIGQYLNSAMLAQQWGKPFMMFETNTASCGGFPGVSDSFASALWAVDYGLHMAYSNFTGALLHVGGQNVSYNVSSYRPWLLYLLLMIPRSHSLVSRWNFVALIIS